MLERRWIQLVTATDIDTSTHARTSSSITCKRYIDKLSNASVHVHILYHTIGRSLHVLLPISCTFFSLGFFRRHLLDNVNRSAFRAVNVVYSKSRNARIHCRYYARKFFTFFKSFTLHCWRTTE